MGLCSSSGNLSPEEKKKLEEEKKRSKDLERELANQNSSDRRVHKLLLLGTGESGKSTLFKQMIILYGSGFNEAARKTYLGTIQNNIIDSMKTLCHQSQVLDGEHNTGVLPQNQAARDFITRLERAQDEKSETDYHFNAELVNAVAALWKDPGIQRTYGLRSHFQLTDSAAYFFERVANFAKPGCVPAQEDVLRSRIRTTGITEQMLEIEKNQFRIVDVGGQRSERKKWIHCFTEVTAILFVAAINEYDMVLFEDETTNRVKESLDLFQDVINNQFFSKINFILFLNKTDLLRKKIEVDKVPLPQEFDYDGPLTYAAVSKFFEDSFMVRKKSKSKQLYVHHTTATDTENMRFVFNAVNQIIIRQSLQEGGLLA